MPINIFIVNESHINSAERGILTDRQKLTTLYKDLLVISKEPLFFHLRVLPNSWLLTDGRHPTNLFYKNKPLHYHRIHAIILLFLGEQ